MFFYFNSNDYDSDIKTYVNPIPGRLIAAVPAQAINNIVFCYAVDNKQTYVVFILIIAHKSEKT